MQVTQYTQDQVQQLRKIKGEIQLSPTRSILFIGEMIQGKVTFQFRIFHKHNSELIEFTESMNHFADVLPQFVEQLSNWLVTQRKREKLPMVEIVQPSIWARIGSFFQE